MSPIRNGFTLCIPPWHCSKGHSLAVEDDCRHLFRRLLLGPNAHDIHDAASHASEDVTHRRGAHQNQISTPFNTCALQSERSSHLQARSPRHQPQYHLTSAKNWGWPIPEKIRSTRASDGRYLALLGMGLEARQIAVAHREIWIYYLFTCSSYL